jgi:type II secretory pathway pseudopilin PulG
MANRHSVSLVEVIVSLTVLSLVILGTTGIFVAGKRHLKRAEYKQKALNFAREKLEELERLEFDDPCLGQGTYPTAFCPDERDLPDGWQRIWYIDDLNLDDDEEGIVDNKNIRVRVEWQGPSL